MNKLAIGEVCNVTKGKTGITKAIPGEYPLVTTRSERLSHNEPQFDCKAVCVPLVSSTGHGHASIKRIHYQEGNFALGSILAAITSKDENILDTEFLYIYLSVLKDRILVPLMQGTANVSMSIKVIKGAMIDLPSIEKQKQIVETYQYIFPIWESLTELYENQQLLIDNTRQSILHLAVQGRLVRQDANDEPAAVLLGKIKAEKERLIEEKKIRKSKPLPLNESNNILFELPIKWEWTKLDAICYQITDGAHHTPTYTTTGIPFLSVKDISSGTIKLSNTRFISREQHEELTKRCNPKYGDILLTKVGTTGIAKVIDVNIEFSIFVSLALLKYPQDLISSHFLELLINAPFVKEQSSKNTQGVGNKNLVLKRIKNFDIPLPPLEEQRRIVARVDQLMTLCDDLETKLKQSQTDGAKLMEAVVHKLVAA